MVQQPITRQDVYEPDLAVTIGGRTVDAVSVSMERALPDPVQGDALRSASGTVIAAEGPDVMSTIVTPWDPASQWPPVPQTPASVRIDTGAGMVEILGDGMVTDSSAGSDSREVAIGVADAYESLNRPISWDNLADAMPALTEATSQRLVSLRATAVTDMILRHCGWYCTPPRIAGAVLSVPAMGTMWPEWGACLTSTQADGSGYPPMFTERWGVGVGDVSATYTLAGTPLSIKDRGRIELTAIAGRATGTTLLLEAQATGANVRLSWNDATAYAWVTDPSGATVSVLSLPRSVGSYLYMTVERVTDTSARVILRVDGDSSEVTVPCRNLMMTSPYTGARILGGGVGAGFQIGFPNNTGSLAGWKPNAVIYDRAASFNHLLVRKAVEGEDCAKLLQDQCEAQAATYWIDETGVLRWWDLSRLENRSAVATLTSDDDIRSDDRFEWSLDRSSLRSRVVVDWQEPLVEGGWRTNVDLWQGSGSTLDTTTTDNAAEEWIKTPTDEVWIMPDLTPSRVGDSYGDFNYGWGTWYGGVTAAGSMDTDHWAQLDGSLLWSIERITDSTFKATTIWTGSKPATQKTLDSDSRVGTGLWRRRCDFDLPIFRGKKKYMLADRTTVSTQKGPARAPEHAIDAGQWIQTEAQARYTADYYGARVTIPQPQLGNVGLVPIPGLQLGDMVDVVEDVVTRLTIRGVIVWDDRTIGRRNSHAIAVRPVAVSRNGVTWAEWVAMTPSTWKQWATAEGGTWQQWGSNPLNE